ncbi:vacuolar sorting SNF8-like protein, putative [Babesia ovis]|uniref:Vacuolar sorting SNF8-like protein, putative n=1 Tax=Babesia ovis TaxID=5869 RepID=A0A9W5TB15_BABOV|nr:vacuolar sorting SNF8-like protein, putative [Babesia ovis]
MRRGIGASRVLNSQKEQIKWDSLSQSLSKDSVKAYKQIAEDFKVDLYAFIQKYKHVINTDPSFRIEFLELCDLMGVDPLSGSSSTLSRLLGLTSFYVEIAIRLMEICIQTRALNGGLCEMNHVLAAFPTKLKVTERDIMRSIHECAVFGPNSIRTMCIKGKTLIITSPVYLGGEQQQCLHYIAEVKGGITVLDLSAKLGWTDEKAQNLLDQFIQRQIVWIDHADDETYYWFPCLF